MKCRALPGLLQKRCEVVVNLLQRLLQNRFHLLQISFVGDRPKTSVTHAKDGQHQVVGASVDIRTEDIDRCRRKGARYFGHQGGSIPSADPEFAVTLVRLAVPFYCRRKRHLGISYSRFDEAAE